MIPLLPSLVFCTQVTSSLSCLSGCLRCRYRHKCLTSVLQAYRQPGQQQLLLTLLFNHPPFLQLFTAHPPHRAGLFFHSSFLKKQNLTSMSFQLPLTFALFLHRHVRTDLLEEESPGGEATGWGKDSRLYPHHCSDSSTSSPHVLRSLWLLHPSLLCVEYLFMYLFTPSFSLRSWLRLW